MLLLDFGQVGLVGLLVLHELQGPLEHNFGVLQHLFDAGRVVVGDGLQVAEELQLRIFSVRLRVLESNEGVQEGEEIRKVAKIWPARYNLSSSCWPENTNVPTIIMRVTIGGLASSRFSLSK